MKLDNHKNVSKSQTFKSDLEYSNYLNTLSPTEREIEILKHSIDIQNWHIEHSDRNRSNYSELRFEELLNLSLTKIEDFKSKIFELEQSIPKAKEELEKL